MRRRIPPCYQILIPIAMAIFSVATTTLQMYQQNQQMNYQARLQQGMNNVQGTQVNKTLNVEYATSALQLSQEARATASKNYESTVASMKAQSEARTALSSTGLSGLSLNNILHEYDMAKAAKFDRNSQNMKFTSEALDAANWTSHLNAQTSLSTQPVPQYAGSGAYLASGLAIGSSALGGAAEVYKQYAANGNKWTSP